MKTIVHRLISNRVEIIWYKLYVSKNQIIYYLSTCIAKSHNYTKKNPEFSDVCISQLQQKKHWILIRFYIINLDIITGVYIYLNNNYPSPLKIYIPVL